MSQALRRAKGSVEDGIILDGADRGSGIYIIEGQNHDEDGVANIGLPHVLPSEDPRIINSLSREISLTLCVMDARANQNIALLIFRYVFCFCFFLFTEPVFGFSPGRWDFEAAYGDSKDVFIAEVLEAETSLEIETDRVGQGVKEDEVVRVVWSDARRFKLSVAEVFKGEQPDVFEVYNGGGDTLKKEEGYHGALSQIWISDPRFSFPRPMLQKGSQYLFFINRNDDSKMTEIGWRSAFLVTSMEEEIETLRILSRKTSEWSIPAAHKAYLDRIQKRDEALKAEYLEILNTTPDLLERKLKLKTYLKRLGFEVLWTKYDSKNRLRSYPPMTIEEWIWYDASLEIAKINMILIARDQQAKKKLDALKE